MDCLARPAGRFRRREPGSRPARPSKIAGGDLIEVGDCGFRAIGRVASQHDSADNCQRNRGESTQESGEPNIGG